MEPAPNTNEVRELVDSYVADGDFDAAWARARSEAEPTGRWRLHGGLVALAAAAVLALALWPSAPTEPEASPGAPAVVAPTPPEVDPEHTLGVGRFLPSGAERPVASFEVSDPDVLEVRAASPTLFALVGHAPGVVDLTLAFEDDTTEVRTYAVVAEPLPRPHDVWLTLGPGAALEVQTELEGLSIAAPDVVAEGDDEERVRLVAGEVGVSDVLLKPVDQPWLRVSVRVLPDARSTVQPLRVSTDVLEPGQDASLPGRWAVSSDPEIVRAGMSDQGAVVLRALAPGYAIVSYVEGDVRWLRAIEVPEAP